MNRNYYLTAFCLIILTSLTLCSDTPVVFAQSSSETEVSTDKSALTESERPVNFLEISSNPIQAPEEGLSDEERETLNQLRTIVDTMIHSSSIDEVIEKCNETSTSIFHDVPRRNRSLTGAFNRGYHGPNYYRQLSRFNNRFRESKATSSIILHNYWGQVFIELPNNDDHDATEESQLKLPESILSLEAILSLLKEDLPESAAPLNPSFKEHDNGGIIGVSIVQCYASEQAEFSCFCFHPNGMLSALYYGTATLQEETSNHTPIVDHPFEPTELVKRINLWDANGKLLTSHVFDVPAPFPDMKNDSSRDQQ